jgi:Protein of unknown function (DUF3568)
MKKLLITATLALGSALFVGCQSKHEEGVKSTYRSQSTEVMALPPAVANAAKDVLSDMGLKNINKESTNVDGMVTAMKADDTKVSVTIDKVEKMDQSKVWVTVGTLGDPALGAEIAKAIKTKAEGTPKM